MIKQWGEIMRLRINDRGITLVELLVALVLLGFISIIIWSFFFQALNLNDREVTKNHLQQEANLIVNTIQQLHTKSTITSIVPSNSNRTLTIYYDDRKAVFENKNILYIIESPPIVPSKEFKFSLTLESSSNASVQFQVETTFSKLN